MFKSSFFLIHNFFLEEDLCTTPRQKPGTCILLNKCDSLYRLLLKQPVLQRDTDYLRQSHCGFVGTEPKVCCPVEYESGQTSTRPPNRYPNHNNNENEYGGEKGSVQGTAEHIFASLKKF